MLNIGKRLSFLIFFEFADYFINKVSTLRDKSFLSKIYSTADTSVLLMEEPEKTDCGTPDHTG